MWRTRLSRAVASHLRHGVAMEVLEQHHDLEQVRALLGHARSDMTQIYASIRPPQLKRAASFYKKQATRMLGDGNGNLHPDAHLRDRD
jgi:site-specific recombinase XerD